MTSIDEQLDRLAQYQPADLPVISLYLDARSNEHGRDAFDAYLRKEFSQRAKAFAPGSEQRKSFEADTERIQQFLSTKVQPSANGIAIFACAGAEGFFEAVQLDTPIEQNALYVNDQPNLYHLARLNDQYPRYAVLMADTNSARILVFALRKLQRHEEVQNLKTRGTSMGGWSQARYQRHIQNYHLHHAKEVIDILDKVVRAEGIQHVIVCGDEVIVPTLREQMPQQLSEKVLDILKLDIHTPDHEVLTATLEKLRQKDAETDAAKVERLMNEYRSGGLGVVGVAETLAALGIGQVDELLITTTPVALDEDAVLEATTSTNAVLDAATAAAGELHEGPLGETAAAPVIQDEEAKEITADALVTAAKQTSARVTFIEDPALLAEVGGVGALLRYRI